MFTLGEKLPRILSEVNRESVKMWMESNWVPRGIVVSEVGEGYADSINFAVLIVGCCSSIPRGW